MTFAPTVMGVLTCITLLTSLLFRPLSFFWCLPALATLQTFALFVVVRGEMKLGASLFNGAMLVAGLFLVARTASRSRRLDLVAVLADRSARIWMLFAAVCIVSAICFPALFSGSMVATQIDHTSVYTPLTPLSPNMNHLAQAVNSIGMLVILMMVGVTCRQYGAKPVARSLILGLVLAALVACSVTLLQRAHYLGVVSFDIASWATNPTVLQSFDTDHAAFGAFRRTALPFIEPSYASAWFAAVAAASFATICFASDWNKASCLIFLVSFAALMNTLSATGFLAFAVWAGLFVTLTYGMVLLRWLKIGTPYWSNALTRAASIQALLLTIGLTAVFASAELRGLLGQVGSKWTELAVVPPDDTPTRGMLNSNAMSAFFVSRGLGLGVGSVKASGFFHGLLANVGIAGTLLFIAALAVQSKRAFHLLTHTGGLRDVSIAYLAGMSCLLISLAGGISDQNWPVLWIMIFLGYAISLCDGVDTDVPIPTRRDSHEPASTLNPSAPPADSAAAPPAAAASAQRPPTVTSQSTPHKPAPK
jgi:hypothetical protein